MKAGEQIIITTGEYSDYGIRDSFVVFKTFSFDRALDRWLEMHHESGQPRSFRYDHGRDEQAFLAWLRAEGYVADWPLRKLHLGNYNEAEANPANDAEDSP